MIVRKRLAFAAVAALASAALVGTAPASADSPKGSAQDAAKVTVIAKGLEGPRQLSATSNYFYVAESDASQVSRVRRTSGTVQTVVKDAPVAQGVVRTDGKIYIASGEAEPDEGGAVVKGSTRLLVAKSGHKPHLFADLLKYELTYNPDNQTQFGSNGAPLDAVANPYYVIRSKSKRGYLLVANAGGNDIIAVSKKGKMSTYFVPPSVTTGPCAEQPQNSDAGPSCDAVPTGMAYGPDGNLYISAATSLIPGEGRVYVLDKNGKLVKTLTGFSGPTGVAVGSDGSVYVSELLEGAPLEKRALTVSAAAKRLAKTADEPDFDPSTIGQIVKVAPNGDRTYAQVTMPSGLLYTGGKLYASAWAVAGLLGIPHAGQVVAVDPSSFVK